MFKINDLLAPGVTNLKISEDPKVIFYQAKDLLNKTVWSCSQWR